jgi:hypothetical protein
MVMPLAEMVLVKRPGDGDNGCVRPYRGGVGQVRTTRLLLQQFL